MKWALLFTVLITLVIVVFTTGLASPRVPSGVEEEENVDCATCTNSGIVLTVIQVMIVVMFVGILLTLLFFSERSFKKRK